MIQQRRNKFPWGYIQGCYSNITSSCCPITPSEVNFKIVFCTFNTGQHKHNTELFVVHNVVHNGADTVHILHTSTTTLQLAPCYKLSFQERRGKAFFIIMPVADKGRLKTLDPEPEDPRIQGPKDLAVLHLAFTTEIQ